MSAFMNARGSHGSAPQRLVRQILDLTAALGAAATLVACGSGGGSSAPAGGGAAPAYQALVTSVTAATYTAGSQNAILSAQIGTIRRGSGSGLLAQNTSLDVAASNHAAFLVNNQLVVQPYLSSVQAGGILGGHFENAALPGYTGATPQVRATAAGFMGSVTELAVFGAAGASDCVAALADSVYHLIDLVSPSVDLGLSFNAGTAGASACLVELGTASTTLGQLPAAGSVVIYPASGQGAVPPTYYNQAENPSPLALTAANYGHPVLVSLYTLANPSLAGSDVVVNAFTLAPTGGSALPAIVLAASGVTAASGGPTVATDLRITTPGVLVLVTTAPLLANTAYTASFHGTVKGAALTKTWSFTTGAAN
jgi:hypothetical protein